MRSSKIGSGSLMFPIAFKKTGSFYFPSMAGVLPKYFHSEWSVAQFRLHEGEQYIVAFGHEKNTVSVVGMDGR